MPDRDLSYIDDELTANDEFITWMGSDDSADSTHEDPRLTDGAAGSFDYYAGGGLSSLYAGPGSARLEDLFARWTRVGHIADDAALTPPPSHHGRRIGEWGGARAIDFSLPMAPGSVSEQILRGWLGLWLPPASEVNFDCPVIPGTDDPVARYAALHGLDGYAAREALRLAVRNSLRAIGPLIDALAESFRPLTAALRMFEKTFSQMTTVAPQETVQERALRLRRERNTGPAALRLDGRRSRRG